MDTRYNDQGYAAKLVEELHGAYVTITKNDVVVGRVSIGFFSGGWDTEAQIEIQRFRPNEFIEINTIDDFEARA